MGRQEGPSSEPQIHLFPCKFGFCLFAGKRVITRTRGNNGDGSLFARASAGGTEFVVGVSDVGCLFLCHVLSVGANPRDCPLCDCHEFRDGHNGPPLR